MTVVTASTVEVNAEDRLTVEYRKSRLLGKPHIQALLAGDAAPLAEMSVYWHSGDTFHLDPKCTVRYPRLLGTFADSVPAEVSTPCARCAAGYILLAVVIEAPTRDTNTSTPFTLVVPRPAAAAQSWATRVSLNAHAAIAVATDLIGETPNHPVHMTAGGLLLVVPAPLRRVLWHMFILVPVPAGRMSVTVSVAKVAAETADGWPGTGSLFDDPHQVTALWDLVDAIVS